MAYPIQPQHLLWWLIVAHVLADWCWQGNFIAENKGKNGLVMFAHCIAWGGVVSVPLALAGVLVPWKIPFLVLGHAMIDIWKCRSGVVWGDKEKHFMRYVAVDQILHLVQLAVVANI